MCSTRGLVSERCPVRGVLWVVVCVVFGLLVVHGRVLAQEPAAPTVDSVAPGDGSLSVGWTAPAGVVGVTAYDLRWIETSGDESVDGNWTEVGDVWTGSGDLLYVLGDLDNGVGYDVQVRTVTSVDGVWSATSVGTPRIPGPVIGSVVVGDGALTVVWTAPTVAATRTVASYDLRYIETSADESVDGNWTVVEDFGVSESLVGVLAGLVNGTGYDVDVRAVADTDGAWSATATGTPAEHGGTTATATTLVLGTPLGGSIDPSSDEDFFELELSSAATVLIRTTGDLDTVGELLDQHGGQLDSNDDGRLPESPRNFAIWRAAQAGTYYLKVTGDGTALGPYVLHATEIEDTTSTSNAITVRPDTATIALVDYLYDTDYFEVTLSEETDLVIRTSGSVPFTEGELLNSSGGRIVRNEFGFLPPQDLHFLIRRRLAAGTYFVKAVGSPPGPYTLYVESVSEPGDTTADAIPLVAYRAEGGRIDPESDTDYFRIEIGRDTHIVLGAVSETVDIDGSLLDSSGEPIEAVFYEETLLGGDVMRFLLRASLSPGTYYIEVTRSGGAETGLYSILMVDDQQLEDLLDQCSGLSTTIGDPLYGCQWHLKNTGQLGGTSGEDINVEGVWAGGNMGAGINVAVVDVRLDLIHEDLSSNTDATRSHLYGAPGGSSGTLSHGTQVAGIVAARDNSIGVRGVAPRATILAYDTEVFFVSPSTLQMSIANIADAMTRNMELVAVSNMSVILGLDLVAAHQIWEDAVSDGITEGYEGKGVFYVIAAGNDAGSGGNANLDEYKNHHAVTAACAVNDLGERTAYSEEGANLWVCAPSADPHRGRPGVLTTAHYNTYTPHFGGTSAAAPAVSGVAALVRAANTDLTWRDVKLILAGSARKNDPSNSGWEQGALEYGSGDTYYSFNHEYGFGVVDAGAAVALADGWTAAPAFTTVTVEWDGTAAVIPDLPSSGTPVPIERSVTVGPEVEFVEFVEINTDFDVAKFREVEVELVSPSGKVSVLAPARTSLEGQLACRFQIDCRLDGGLRFGSAKHLGEDPEGEWKLRMTDRVSGSTPGRLESWSITVYGHRSTPAAPVVDSVGEGAEALIVAWTAPTNGGASGISAYDVRHIRSDASDKADDQWTVTEDVWTSGSGGALEYTVSGLTANLEYDVQVRAVNTDGDGLWSSTETGTPTTDKSPTIDSATPGDRSITLGWTAPTNPTLGTVTGYDLRYIRSDATNRADSNWTVVTAVWTAGTLDYILNPTTNPLTNGVSYDVQMRAVVGTVQHPWSGARSATPRTTPSAPTINSVTGITTGLGVGWSKPSSDGGATITSYDLRHIETSADETVDSNWTVRDGVWTSGALAATVTGLDVGTQYDVQVRAVNASGEGGWSATRVGTTLPGALTLDSVTGIARGLAVGWTAPSGGGGATITSYDLRYVETSADETVDGNWTVRDGVWTSGALAATVTGLDVGTQYDVQVRAVNASGEGPWSATRAGTTALSDDASLSTLILGGARLSPAFSSGTTSYTASVGYTVTRVTVSATPNDSNAGIVVADGNGNTLTEEADGYRMDLSVGSGNVIRVEVAAQDGIADGTYTIRVTRTSRDLSLTPQASDPSAPTPSTATYTIRFRGLWTTAVTPDRLPGGAHFSRLIGAVHNAGVTFLESGGTASPGVESMAEVGGTAALEAEVNTAKNADPQTARSVIEGSTNFISRTATRTLSNIKLTTEYPRVTLTTMIAPSHDWFVGISGLPLLNASGRWLRSPEVDLFPWDAGTEEGDDFSLSPSVDTVPRGVITSIRGTGRFTTDTIANLTFTLQTVETERSVVENTPAGVNIGASIAAVATSGTVSYTLGGADASSFDLDTHTGQLRTKAGVTYDHETKNSHAVTVTATDTDGSITTTVNIAVTDDEEAPVITGPAHLDFEENDTADVGTYRATDPEGESVTWLSLAGDDSGAFELSAGGVLTFKTPPDHERQNRYQVMLRAWDGTNYGTLDVVVTVTNVNEAPVISGDASPDFAENGTGTVAFYSASDPERSPVTLSLAGTDAGDFELSSGGVLMFDPTPNYESPADSNRDNVYEVTVRAWDGNSYATLDVVVTVTNEDEDGTVALSSVQPQVGTALEADLSDPDGSVTATTWVWARSTNRNGPWSTIGGETSDSYTPTPADADLNRFLRATASYTDGEGPDKTAEALSTNQVQPAPVTNTAPEFPTSETGQREVEENTPTGRPIGDPVVAVDTNVGDTLTYQLDGTDAAAFDIDELSGQLRTKTAVDYETKRSYSMTLTVTDTSGADDSITVRVSVTNIDEPSDLGGPTVVDYDENNRGTVASYIAVDPERATITWTLAGDDQDDFRISSRGVLTFASPPDYETPTDSGGNNTYEVTVQASDGTHTPTQTLTVTVTNLDEDGSVTLTTTTSRPQAGTVVEATLDDPDGGTRNTVWRWARSTNRRDWTPIPGTNTDSYTPASTDAGQYLQAAATYDDDQGPTKTAAAHTTHTVANPTQTPRPPSTQPPPSSGPGGPGGGGGPAPLPPGANQPPEFSEGSRTVRTIAENSPAGTDIGAPVTATDPEEDPLTYKLAGTDADHFDLNTSTGQLKTKAALDFETKNAYTITVEVGDSKNPDGEADRRRDDSIRVTILIGNQNDPGWVTLSSPTPRVDQPLKATVSDPDGDITDRAWKWEQSPDRTTWTPITEATTNIYTPTSADTGLYLRVTTTYGDAFRLTNTTTATPPNPVTIGHATAFTDLTAEGVHTPAINALASDGLFADTECGPNRFCPHEPIQRWTMAVWLIRILGGDPTTVGVSRFGDIAAGQWWIRHVEQLADRQITVGCTTNPPRYCPDKSVTRAQMASFLVRAFQLAPAETPARFADTEDNVHTANIDTLAAAGITVGCTNEPLQYCPNQAVTRAQMATFLHRALNHQPNEPPRVSRRLD